MPDGPESSCTTQAFIFSADQGQRRLKVACLAPDRSSISDHRPAMSSTEGGAVNVTPSFWNSAVRCTLPPPTMKMDPLSGTSSVHRYATTGATYSGVRFLSTSGGRMSSVIRVAAMGASALVLMLYLAPSWASVLISPTRPSLAAP